MPVVRTFGALSSAGASLALIASLTVAVGASAACGSPVLVQGDGEGTSATDGGTMTEADGAIVPLLNGTLTGPGTFVQPDGAVAPTKLFPFVGGTNLSGAEFGPSKLPGTYNTDYTYPTHAEIDGFTAKGLKIFRFPFLWERMQPKLGGAFDTTELGRLTDLVDYATSKGAYAILDPQNFARYRGVVIGSGATNAPTAEQFGQFWATLAAQFASNPLVIFGLMNEPSKMQTELWLTDANAAIAGIRGAQAINVIFVPGNGFTGAYDWTDSSGGGYGTANGTVMLGIVDPLDRYVFEVHQYNDSDSSGTHKQCSSDAGSKRLVAFTNWLETNHKRGFLGELATTTDSSCDGVLEDTLSYIDQHKDVWAGWTWWSAGPWWGSYMFTLEPKNGVDQPQMATLLKHL